MSEISIGQFLLIIFLVLLNAFFVASEFAFVKVRPTKIKQLIASGSKRAVRVKQIIDDLDRSLSSTQLGITVASIGLGFAGEEFFKALLLLFFDASGNLFNFDVDPNSKFLDGLAFTMGYLIITWMHVTIGELAPKSISIQFSEQTALILAEPLYWFMVITDPLLKFFVWSSNSILKLIKVPPAKESHHQVYTEDELKVIIEDSIVSGELEPYESRLIFNILNFTDRNVKSIITPRIDIKALPETCTPHDIVNLSREKGFSRIPIYGENMDDVKGFIHVKDLIGINLNEDQSKFDINKILRQVIITLENKPLDDLLREMQKQKTQVAIIVNEYGSVEGIVTIEDILEYIVGPIDDEFDEDSAKGLQVNEEFIDVDGLITIEALNLTLNSHFESNIDEEPAYTLAGYILEICKGDLPSEGTSVEDEKFEFIITKIIGNRIERVRIHKLSENKQIEK